MKSNANGSYVQRQITYTIQSGTTTITDPIYFRENAPNPTTDSCGRTVTTSAPGGLSSVYPPYNGYQITDFLADSGSATQSSCSFSYPNQQWSEISPSQVIATIGLVNVSTSAVVVNGNNGSPALDGTDFTP
jgi:hypothetical protein